MMLVFRTSKEQMEAVRSYVSGEKDIEVIEKAVKGDFLRRREEETEKREEPEVVEVEEEKEENTRYDNINPSFFPDPEMFIKK